MQFLCRYAFLFAAGFGMLLFFSTLNTVLQTIVHDHIRQRDDSLGSLEADDVAHSVTIKTI